jgi:hypothetical protein
MEIYRLGVLVGATVWLTQRGSLSNLPHYSVVLSLPAELEALTSSQLVWNSSKGFVRWPEQAGKKVPIAPALGPKGSWVPS